MRVYRESGVPMMPWSLTETWARKAGTVRVCWEGGMFTFHHLDATRSGVGDVCQSSSHWPLGLEMACSWFLLWMIGESLFILVVIRGPVGSSLWAVMAISAVSLPMRRMRTGAISRYNPTLTQGDQTLFL